MVGAVINLRFFCEGISYTRAYKKAAGFDDQHCRSSNMAAILNLVSVRYM
jgi:hypothetical protein